MNPIYIRIKELAIQQHVALRALERQLKLSNGIISNWRYSSPSVDNIAKVADYFHVSIEYLIGKEDPLPKTHRDLIAIYQKTIKDMSPQEKSRFKRCLPELFDLIAGVITSSE